MGKKLIGTLRLKDLPVGHFASINGNIVYRYRLDDERESYWFPPSVLIVEKHGHLDMGDAYRGYDGGTAEPSKYGYYCDPIEHPDKKHCDNVIAMIRKMVKEDKINGLAYVESLSTTKHYIQEHIKRHAK